MKGFITSIVFVVILTLLYAFQQNKTNDWCKTQESSELRQRTLTTSRFRSFDDLFRGAAQGKVALIAHRGGFTCEELDRAPENSLANVEKAIRMGFDVYETDLWRTSDGEYVIHHDSTLDRTTTGSGRVSDTTLKQISRLRLKYPSGQLSTEKVPTLRELISAGRERILFLVEPKGEAREHLPEILQILKETESMGQVLIWVTWEKETVELYERQLKSGLEEVRTSVVWRVDNIKKFDDITTKFDPLFVDLVPSMNAMRLESSFLNILPKEHLSLVENVAPQAINIMVSKVISDSYLDILYDRGIRMFMSRDPERQLHHLIEKGLHP
jgi:hypothetical protein